MILLPVFRRPVISKGCSLANPKGCCTCHDNDRATSNRRRSGSHGKNIYSHNILHSFTAMSDSLLN